MFNFRNIFITALLFFIVTVRSTFAEPRIYLIKVDGIINPISARYVKDAIKNAERNEVECLVMQLDTPGGLMESMRTIVGAILGAEVPVVVYISPTGARAASAGVFITMAAHIAAMAPSTHLGAAHPVGIGPGGATADSSGTMTAKITNDAVAYVKSIAERRKRNAKWAEKAVRQSVSVTETEAVKLNVVDFISPNLDSLLLRIDGRKVNLDAKTVTLHTKNAERVNIELSWANRILDKIIDPNIAYILMLLGIYGLIFELSNPGALLPGIVGGISLVLAFLAFQVLPINFAGLALIIFAVILFIAEVKVASHGLLAVGGAISMLLGSMMLIDTPLPFLRVSVSLIFVAVVTTTLFFLFAVGMGIRAQRRKPTTGMQGLIGEIGEAQSDIDPEGRVFLHGEIWRARSDSRIEKGEEIKVLAVEGLRLRVSKKEDS